MASVEASPEKKTGAGRKAITGPRGLSRCSMTLGLGYPIHVCCPFSFRPDSLQVRLTIMPRRSPLLSWKIYKVNPLSIPTTPLLLLC
jgi:hypothetical protein